MSILEVNNVSIRYMTGDFKEIGLKEYVLRRLKGNYHVNEFWADKDVSFTLDKGDMLGIIGTNGAGKSTLLKAVVGIMEPTKGWVKREGNIAALLELASGFDGDLTVQENTYLRGAILGYTRKFMDETYDQIIDFAELRDFEHRPFKQLSSGMKSRLAFSIASLVQPDILILDEVLSVGDGAFRAKSEAKMREIIAGGATILVSHSIGQVRQMCNKVLWLHKGEQVAYGDDVKGICDRYEAFLAGDRTKLYDASTQDAGIEVQNGSMQGTNAVVGETAKDSSVQKISMFGSCMSRDVLRLFLDAKIELCSYIARQSIVSAVSPHVSLEMDQIQLASDFQKRMVLWDFKKDTFELLKNDGSEWLMIDLIDERFSLAVLGDSFVTRSAEALQGNVIPKKAKLVTPKRSGSDYYVNGVCIREYISLFCKKLLEIYAPDHIIIHRALPARLWKDAQGAEHLYDTGKNGTDRRVRDLLSYMYSVIREEISLARVIDCTENFCGSENHTWGLASVHYEDEYYKEVAKQLKEICCLSDSAKKTAHTEKKNAVEQFLDKETVYDGKYPIRYVLQECPGAQWLIVIFSAFSPKNHPVQHPYNFIGHFDGFPAHRLYIQDSCGCRGTYYLCDHMDFAVEQTVSNLICEIQNRLQCDNEQTVSIGSSKGGSAATYFALKHGFSHALAMVPQFYIGTYVNMFKDTRLDMFADNHSEDIKVLDALIETVACNNHRSKIHVLTSQFDEQYSSQILPFMDFLKQKNLECEFEFTFEDGIKAHSETLHYNAAFSRRGLYECIFGLNFQVDSNNLRLWKTPATDASKYTLQYRYITKNGQDAVCSITNVPQSIPLSEIFWGEFCVKLQERDVHRLEYCTWNSAYLNATCIESESEWKVVFEPSKNYTLPFEYAFYIHDGNNCIHKQMYFSETSRSIPRKAKSGNTVVFFWKYKDTVVTKRAVIEKEIVQQKEETNCAPQREVQPDYRLTKENGVLCFSLDVESTESLTYAFYVQRGNQYIFKQWYGTQTHLVYPIKEAGEYRVVYFIRTPDGAVAIGESNSINFLDSDINK